MHRLKGGIEITCGLTEPGTSGDADTPHSFLEISLLHVADAEKRTTVRREFKRSGDLLNQAVLSS